MHDLGEFASRTDHERNNSVPWGSLARSLASSSGKGGDANPQERSLSWSFVSDPLITGRLTRRRFVGMAPYRLCGRRVGSMSRFKPRRAISNPDRASRSSVAAGCGFAWAHRSRTAQPSLSRIVRASSTRANARTATSRRVKPGNIIVGAQPFATFDAQIQALLAVGE